MGIPWSFAVERWPAVLVRLFMFGCLYCIVGGIGVVALILTKDPCNDACKQNVSWMMAAAGTGLLVAVMAPFVAGYRDRVYGLK